MDGGRTPSEATLRVLRALMAQPDAPRYGYELMKTIGIKSGTLYPILMRLSDRGLLTADWRPSIEGKPPRHSYRLTDAGVAYAAKLLASARQGRSGWIKEAEA